MSGRTARGAATVLALLILGALAAPWLAPADPRTQHDLALIWQPPSDAHLLGTDSAARDVLSRLLHGSRVTLGVAGLAVLVSLTLGTLIGASAAVLRGLGDALLMRFTDAMLAMPRLLLLILVVAGWGNPGNTVLAILIGATGWMTTSRLVRQETRRILVTEHLNGARALGVPRRRLLTRHVLPALAPTLAAAAVLSFAAAVPLETGLSFLGLGVQAPHPSWGNIIADADSRPLAHWWLVLFPTLAIAATVIAANAIAEGFARRARTEAAIAETGPGA
jgi:peptide/nickel transport system permease protein